MEGKTVRLPCCAYKNRGGEFANTPLHILPLPSCPEAPRVAVPCILVHRQRALKLTLPPPSCPASQCCRRLPRHGWDLGPHPQCLRGELGGPGLPSGPALRAQASHHLLGLHHHQLYHLQRRLHHKSYHRPRGSGGLCS